jgi:CPA1 family monovalent cation:H+ antiporter
MNDIALIPPIELITVLLLIAAAVAMSVKVIKVPYSTALVIVGLFIGLTHIIEPIYMTPDLILIIFLPALLFEASWNLNFDLLKKNWLPIIILSIVGVVISTFIIGGLLQLCHQIDMQTALLFGAIISATDPISVLAIFKKLAVNEEFTTIIEAESLFNDGAAVTLFQIMLLLATSGHHISFAKDIVGFLTIFGGGIIVGLLIGFLFCKIISFFDDHLLELMLTTLVAYGTLLLAKQLGVSQVMSVVSAGIVLGSYGKKVSMSNQTQLTITTFWEYAAFVVNSLVFLLIGLQINLGLLVKYINLIAVAIIAVVVSRFVVSYILVQISTNKTNPIPLAWRHLLFWGGLRGSLSMALALSLPITFPARELIIVLTFGVVLFTLVIQGLTIAPLTKLLKKNNATL